MRIEIRPVGRDDIAAVVSMVHELAEYERAEQECHLAVEQLQSALFGPNPSLFGHVAYMDDAAEPVGCALWFLNFSTWLGTHGIYLEDLYVRPAARGNGVGRALLTELAAICVDRGYERLDWWVLHWNPARAFYQSIGAQPMDDWVPYRLAGPALQAMAHARRTPRRAPTS
jgi:GNAT superfamily N-acetyltransferase